jgi:hypothetical protein
VRQFGILIALALATGQPGRCADILRIDPEAQAALTRSTRAEPGLIGVNIHRFQPDAPLDLAREAGFQFARADLMWERVERGGAYRFRAYDALMNALEARGMGALLILDYGHPDHGGRVPRTTEDIAAFGRFAEAAARHFKGRDVRYEIWNEPNLVMFWPPKPNAREYTAVLREAVAAIHRGDPAAKVVSGGVSRIDLKFLREAIEPGLAAELSAIAVHPYTDGGPEKVGPEIGKLREWARRSFGERLEIWDTEWGYSSTKPIEGRPGDGHSDESRLRQARLAVREILTVQSLEFPLGVWYDLQDDGADAGNPEQNYGLLDEKGAPKPAMQAVRTAMTAVKGRRYAGMIQRAPSGMYAMRFDGQAEVLFVIWSDKAGSDKAGSDRPGKRQTVRYTKDNLVSVSGWMGDTVEAGSNRSREAEIEIDEASGPVYLLYRLRR